MRIAILTTGRFHVCDLARELDALGHDVAFYSLVPPWRTRQFGLPTRCNRWLAPLVAPFLAATRAPLRRDLAALAYEALGAALDRVASQVIRRCEVFIGMSGLSAHTARAVRRRYGARVLIERGSRHILSQREILGRLPRPPGSGAPVGDRVVARELEEYELADLVVVPSRHVVDSFVERGFPASRLFRNPYGVDLRMFLPTERTPGGMPTVVMAGSWSLRKGVDVLSEAWSSLPGVRLLHVGSVADAPLPPRPGFEHLPAVDQRRLPQILANGDVFALASREEGLATVQVQALASGLPLVCTDRTGGADLLELVEDSRWVRAVPSDNPARLAEALRSALADFPAAPELRQVPHRERLSWAEYGRRYQAVLAG